MAYDDKDGTKFPTRSGQATGHSNERTMLDELGGADNIRHRQRMGADGLVTHVKTRGGHPHFWNEPLPKDEEDPVSPIYMDSGTVDLLSVSPENPLSALAAPLYYSNDQKAAYAAEKLLGKITPPGITNLDPPVDTAPGESFTPIVGGDLLGKKDCAAKCPPSMFTGKARLYAQSQLGAPLKMWGWTLDLPEGQSPRWVHDSTGFVLDINVGVYTDDTDKHWLISVSGSGVMVTPLKPSKSAKLLRASLSDPAYAADKTKIEAYILAHSAPGGASESFFVTVSGLPPPYMLGYGWKFNWDGSKADIIKHVESFPQHASTHYRLAINRDTGDGFASESNRWTFALSIVEGPVYWHNSKWADVICSPEWVSNTLLTFGTRYGNHYGNAPVYCFYKENGSLEVIRYYGSGGETNTMRSGKSTPASWWWEFDWTVDVVDTALEGGTSGIEGAYGERRTRTENPKSTGFYSDQISTVGESTFWSYTNQYISPKEHDGSDIGEIGSGSGHYADYEEGICVSSGYSPVLVTSDGVTVFSETHENIINTGAAIGYANSSHIPYTFGYTCTRTSYTGTKAEVLSTLLVIPFHDSEAVYLYSSLSVEHRATGTGGVNVMQAHNGGVFYKYIDEYFVLDPEADPVTYWYHRNHYYLKGGMAHQPGLPTDTLDPISENSEEVKVSSIVTRSGVYDFSAPIPMSVFFAGNDFVGQTFYTSSSIHGPMYGFGASNPEGINKAFTSTPPFIGWA